jgi:hypothetical protein
MAWAQKMSLGDGMGDSKRHSHPSAKKSVHTDFFGRIQTACKKAGNSIAASSRVTLKRRLGNKIDTLTSQKLALH